MESKEASTQAESSPPHLITKHHEKLERNCIWHDKII